MLIILYFLIINSIHNVRELLNRLEKILDFFIIYYSINNMFKDKSINNK